MLAQCERPRGLCWFCYETMEIRVLYPSTSKYNPRRNGDDTYATRPAPKSPTTARPGTAEKVAVFESRYAAMTSLWHPQDAPIDLV